MIYRLLFGGKISFSGYQYCFLSFEPSLAKLSLVASLINADLLSIFQRIRLDVEINHKKGDSSTFIRIFDEKDRDKHMQTNYLLRHCSCLAFNYFLLSIAALFNFSL